MNDLSTLSPVLQAFFASLFTSLLTTAGAGAIFFGKKNNENFSVLAESFAAGIMLAASFFSLLSPAFGYPCAIPSWAAVTVGFALGGGFILCADKLLSRSVQNVEGGVNPEKRKSRLLYAAVTLHNIPEGLAVGVAFAGSGFYRAAALAFGVGVQNFPEGLCVACPLRAAGASRKRSFFLSALSGTVEIPAAVLGAFAATVVAGLMPWALSFAAGAMVVVTAAELLPESVPKNKPLALFGLIVGFSLMMLLDAAFA